MFYVLSEIEKDIHNTSIDLVYNGVFLSLFVALKK